MKLTIEFRDQPDAAPVGIPIQTDGPGCGREDRGILAGAQPVADIGWPRHHPGHRGRRDSRKWVAGLLLRLTQPMWQPARVHPAGSR